MDINDNLFKEEKLLSQSRIVDWENFQRQCVRILLLNCSQFEGNGFARYTASPFTKGFWLSLDTVIEVSMNQCFDLQNEEIFPFNKIRSHLPSRLWRLGIGYERSWSSEKY